VNERSRIYAAVFAALVVFGGAAFLLLGKSSGSAAAPHVIKPLHPVKKKAAARRALAPPKLAKAKPQKAFKRPAVVNGLPSPLVDALAMHRVVVLALVTPGSTVDQLTLKEAQAGAAAAHAGFVRISVSNNAQVSALSGLVSSSAAAQDRLLDAPAVLVFAKPQTLYVRLNGYSDADTIRQAAVNAYPGPATTPAS
jgi:glucose/arabinose dehydrogenase